MFIEIKSKKQLMGELGKRILDDVNIHYICPDCDDEQVTGNQTVYEETIEILDKEECIYVNLTCTHEYCGETLKFLYSNYITGVEDI